MLSAKRRQRFPFSLVWTSIPILSWFVPVIGHVGICLSNGIIYDFAGSNIVSIDNFSFGAPMKRRILLDSSSISREEADEWDQAINMARIRFQKLNYNLFTNNCHSYVAECLNIYKYNGKTDWNMVSVFLLTLRCRYISFVKFARSVAFPLLLTTIFVVLALVVVCLSAIGIYTKFLTI